MMDRLGPDVPLHFTAFHPDWKMTDTPPTPPQTLRMARRIATEAGISYVYTGNIHDPAGQMSLAASRRRFPPFSAATRLCAFLKPSQDCAIGPA